MIMTRCNHTFFSKSLLPDYVFEWLTPVVGGVMVVIVIKN